MSSNVSLVRKTKIQRAPTKGRKVVLPSSEAETIRIGLDMLESFLGDTHEIGFARLARSVEANRAAAQRVLTVLEERGYLQRTSDGRKYRLGVRVFELGARFRNSLDIRRAASPELTSLVELTSESGFLCVRDGDNALCLERVEGRHRARIHALGLGERQPLHWGAAPRALLAGMSDPEIAAYAARTGLPRSTPQTIATPDQLLEDVHRTRAQNFVVSYEDVTPGIAAVGSPVRDRVGRVVASISLSGIAVTYTPAHITELAGLLQAAGSRLSRQMGYSGR